MAQITYKGSGAGVSVNGTTALAPAYPATVDANDIAILHVVHRKADSSNPTPSGWTLISGPDNVGTTPTGRSWTFARIAAGTEDGATVTLNTTVSFEKAARIHTFSGYVSGAITDLIPSASIDRSAHANRCQPPTVTVSDVNGAAIWLADQMDNNTAAVPASGATGGTWTEPVAEYSVALTTGLMLAMLVATDVAAGGTITGGGTVGSANDEAGTVAFALLPQPASATVERSASVSATGSVATAAEFFSILERGAATVATGSIATVGQRDLLRSAAASAAGSIATAGQRDLLRQAAVAATGAIATSGEVETPVVTHERSASVSATASIATVGQHELPRAAAVAATGTIEAAGQRDLLRQAALSATATLATAGVRIVERSASISAASVIGSAPQRELQRQAAVTATASVQATGQIEGQVAEHERSASLSATGAIAADGYAVLERAASISTAGTVTATGQRELLRAVALAGTTAIEAAGIRELQRTVSVAAVGLIEATPQDVTAIVSLVLDAKLKHALTLRATLEHDLALSATLAHHLDMEAVP